MNLFTLWCFINYFVVFLFLFLFFLLLVNFSYQGLLMVFHRRLSDSKSPLVSKTLLIILVQSVDSVK